MGLFRKKGKKLSLEHPSGLCTRRELRREECAQSAVRFRGGNGLLPVVVEEMLVVGGVRIFRLYHQKETVVRIERSPCPSTNIRQGLRGKRPEREVQMD